MVFVLFYFLFCWFVCFLIARATCALGTCGLCCRSDHLFGDSVFCAEYCREERPHRVRSRVRADIFQVCPLQPAPTGGSQQVSHSCTALQGQADLQVCQGHIPPPPKLVTGAGFPPFPSKVWAAEMHPAGTEPPGAAAAQSEGLGRVLSSLTGSLWHEWANASRAGTLHRRVAASTSSRMSRGCALLCHLRGVGGEQCEQEQSQRPDPVFSKTVLIFFFFL